MESHEGKEKFTKNLRHFQQFEIVGTLSVLLYALTISQESPFN